MAINLTIAGGTYQYPESGEESWGTLATDAMAAVCANAIWGTNGVFSSLISATANPASTGNIRFARVDTIKWRNQANGADIALGVSSTNILQWGGADLALDTEKMDFISPAVLNNIPKMTAGGQLVDSGLSASTVSIVSYPYANPGKVDTFADLIATSATFPYYYLGTATAIITTTNWPDLVPYLRAIPLRYGTAVGVITITDVTVTGGNTAVLTYTDATEEQVLVTNLNHGFLKYGANIMTLTVPIGGVGGVTAGTWYITDIATAAATRTITLTGTGWECGTVGSLTIDVNSYPFRVADTEATPTVKARMYQAVENDELTYVQREALTTYTYNGVELLMTGSSTLNTKSGFFTPYRTADGYRLKGSLQVGTVATKIIEVTIPGVTFVSDVVYLGWTAAAGCNDPIAGYGHTTAFGVAGTSNIVIYSGSITAYRAASFDLPIAAWPTWALIGKLPWIIEAQANNQYCYMFAKSYIP